ncbi:MAG: hypothetical protein CBD77_04700 [bacterium TMED217]|nr:MAG: hypothetical protein CBD77_04700 [bacterium TMED217]
MQKNKTNELFRKAIHISNIIIPLGYLYIFQEKIEMLMILSFFLIICFFIEIARRKNNKALSFFNQYFSFMMRENEKQGALTGATWVFVGALFTVLLIPAPFSILSLLFLSVGDTFAAIIGMQFPYLKLGEKTLSGSIAGFIACIVSGLIIDIHISHDVLIFGAFMAMFIEIMPLSFDDNVTIPVFSGFSMYFYNIVV